MYMDNNQHFLSIQRKPKRCCFLFILKRTWGLETVKLRMWMLWFKLCEQHNIALQFKSSLTLWSSIPVIKPPAKVLKDMGRKDKGNCSRSNQPLKISSCFWKSPETVCHGFMNTRWNALIFIHVHGLDATSKHNVLSIVELKIPIFSSWIRFL